MNNDQLFILWLILSASSFIPAVILFVWLWRKKYFADQDRARYLALMARGGKEEE